MMPIVWFRRFCICLFLMSHLLMSLLCTSLVLQLSMILQMSMVWQR